MTKFKELSIN